jgi:polyisoprenoid-binding protein YceI
MRNALFLSAALLLAAPAFAADAPAAPPAMVIPHGTSDYTKAVAGAYALDGRHVGVVARILHMGFSFSIFRFDDVSAKLTWDPAAPEKSQLSATVKTATIATNVAGFADDISKKYMETDKFPEATFVSTAFHKIDATHGKVDGNLTLKGVTKAVTFDVTLVGAGPGFGGNVIGVHAETTIDPADYHVVSPFFSGPAQLLIDTEFKG